MASEHYTFNTKKYNNKKSVISISNKVKISTNITSRKINIATK